MSATEAWSRFPVRYCTGRALAVDYCRICGRIIVKPRRYYDGGRGRRAHVDCVEKSDVKAKEEKAEV